MSHGHGAKKPELPSTHAGEIFFGKYKHLAHEGISTPGLGGLQFVADASNPWFLLNSIAEARIQARKNREILAEMEESDKHTEHTHEQLGLKVNPRFMRYMAISPQELTMLEHALNDDYHTMWRHLNRMKKDQAKEVEMLKNYRGRGLTEQEMDLFIKFCEERKKLIAQFRALRATNFSNIEAVQELFKKLDAQNALLQSKKGEFLVFGTLEARAVREAEKVKG